MSFNTIHARLAIVQHQLNVLPLHHPERAKALDEYQQLQATLRAAQQTVRGHLSNLFC